jgi:3-dehydrosphinganine reductase
MGHREYFQDKGVIITGGSSGIGLALAKAAAGAGARVTLVARRRSVLEEAKTEIERAHSSAKVGIVDLDVSKTEDVEAKIGALAKNEAIDILVNNAGVARPGRFLELPIEEFRQQMDINYFGAVNMCRAVLPHMIARGRGGHVANVSSLAGVIGIYGYTAYAPTKFALCGFSQVLRAEMWPHRVKVSVVLPPDTDTPQLAFENQYKPAETRAIAGTVKTLSPDDVALAMMRGMAAGEFEIYCDMASKMSGLAQGVVPGIVRWFCDDAQKKVRTVSS